MNRRTLKAAALLLACAAAVFTIVALCGKHPRPPATMDEALEIARSAGFTHTLGHSPVITVSTEPIIVDPVDGDLRMDTAVGWDNAVRIYADNRSFQDVPGLVCAAWGPLTLFGSEQAVQKLIDATPRTWFP